MNKELLSKEGLIGILKNYKIIKKSAEICGDENALKTLDMLHKIDDIIDALPETHKDIINAIYKNDLTWLQTAEKLYITNNTISRYKQQALNMILDAYNGKYIYRIVHTNTDKKL